MDDLDGRTAYSMLLDAFAEQTKNVVSMQRATEASRNRADDIASQLRKSDAEVLRLRAQLDHFNGADDAAVALYDLIEKAAALIEPADDEFPGNLRRAAAALRKFIDPIPF
jgi:hypothetical protein